jgi:septal ring factor EnvC (AmiA/AmiB activator)
VLVLPLQAEQSDRARTEALAQRATERLQALHAEADRLASEERTLLGDLRKLEVERQIRSEELGQLEAASARLERELAANDQRLHQLEQEDSAARPELRARLVQVYKLGQGRYLRMLLSTSDVGQLAQASRLVAALAKIDHDRVVSHQRTLEEVKSTRAALEERRRKLNALKADAARAKVAADRAAAARLELIRDIDRRRDLNAQLSGELQTAQQKLQLALRDLTAPTSPDNQPALPLRPFRGDLEWPVTGTIIRRFGSQVALRPSNGIEIAAPEGTPVLAIHEGTVALAEPFSGFGNLVIIDHGDQGDRGAKAFSLYGDLLEIAVKKGGRVEKGDTLGTVGTAPAGPSLLYFELRVDGQSVDPLQWLKRR